ncbi:conserved hypothetical protein [Acidothermus cellulolyticus 11B]|uniref:DUF4032 domain-containing protein n=1 Tax=Acidothermus cellulolyticus (strain ATCC 43068 / DSM 8971 / 11B) TaxID=351607 RepID=A0LR00_ACIC1|nr:DUF4032 domain-containing protein [Acidothermus cellulolyticus]ABK51860.1 conserved hypothetical protein [Acidothermus cellulolyticus 11B]
MRMQFASTTDPAELLSLPWSLPLEQWPADRLVTLPRGISRHVVRFVRVSGTVYAIKELPKQTAEREYRMLRELAKREVPVVKARGVVFDRTTDDGRPLDAALVTKHLRFSLPYRALFSRRLEPELTSKLLDALAQLLVRLHLAGFAWKDCSLSNTLFRRDAGALAAYLVDAETGELHDQLSDGQRAQDLEIASVNIAGELYDLEAGGLLDEAIDPAEVADDIVRRYEMLWNELTREEILGPDELWRIEQRLQRLSELGFDATEIQIVDDPKGRRVKFQTQVVEAGHHQRRLYQLTGLRVEENQARRLLQDLDTFRATAVMPGVDVDEETVARHWLTDVFEPVIEQIPPELRGKLEPAEIFHEVLEHRWFMSEAAGHDIGMDAATRSYIENVLRFRPDEQAVLGTPAEEFAESLKGRSP